MNKKELKQISNSLKPQFNVGKLGLTDTFVDQIDKYLDAHNIVKIKSSASEDKDHVKSLSNQIKDKLKCEIIELKGFTFTVYRE